ncbi:hypothetical protein OIK40_07110 [Erythrobacter sp. sf7]|uniref:Adenylate cyclase n=1 Tax=Erythrobacter fulvus TaxID=2987523 RepID=A0ABT5JNQ7_9SPHN|nr:hypothetical protein [Erythrobacter fulvus]MDC8754411.1 hypothetical protein [Erythrobacter fulvus]
MQATSAQAYAAQNRYFRRTAFTLVGIAVVGFIAFNLTGITDITAMPSATHVHAVAMAAWVSVFAAQVMLATGGKIAAHRKLGKAGMALAAITFATSFGAIFATFAAGRVPPFFPPGYFLVLGFANVTMFGLFVAGAAIMRKRTDWHKRLMLGSLVMIYEPVLGRTLPFIVIPALGGPEAAFPAIIENREAFELFRFTVHIAIAGLLLVLDRRVSGRVHPASWIIVGAVAMIYALANGIGLGAGMTEYAISLTPSGTAGAPPAGL